MDRPQSPPPRTPALSLKTNYLILYNFVSAILWTAVLGRVVLLVPMVGYWNAYGGVGNFAKWTQTLAVLEVGHALFGIVRAPLLTTLMQVSSRLLLVWGIVAQFPYTTTTSPFYSSMLLAWSITEVIRYSYFAFHLSVGRVPQVLAWLRYNTFFVLYPLGIASECALVWKSIEPAERVGLGWAYALRGVLFIYVPGE
ncbi:hypothetical protein B0A49_06571 [Cryomyces minteri]|uniref:Very-long-chain (3R)-3-hydroxyacyl-CoA dehydratase n=1 Tax=Cryomyces minteri TaxID=331657 RepID=A0A4U0XCL9_9PEZI|nr:hypothetical protein B0A49_06571 [Cryomyces minteri]